MNVFFQLWCPYGRAGKTKGAANTHPVSNSTRPNVANIWWSLCKLCEGLQSTEWKERWGRIRELAGGLRNLSTFHTIFLLKKKEKTFKVDCGEYVHIFDPVQSVASDITIFAQIEKCKYWDYNNFCCNYIKLIIHIH